MESGIHGKEFSCAMSIRKKEPTCPGSPSATGKGSNLIMEEAVYGNKLTSVRGKSALLPLKMKKMEDENCSAEASNRIHGFSRGDGSSKFHQGFLQEEGTVSFRTCSS